MKKFLSYIQEFPAFKTGIFIGSVLISGILCGAFVTEITVDGKLVWGNFYKETSFWLLCVYSIFVYIYNKFLYTYEKNILKFLDDDYCKAYIIDKCLPQLIDKYNDDLKNNPSGSGLIDIREELNRLRR